MAYVIMWNFFWRTCFILQQAMYSNKKLAQIRKALELLGRLVQKEKNSLTL